MKDKQETLAIIGSFCLLAAGVMLFEWLVSGRSFNPDLMISIGAIGMFAFGIRAYLISRMQSKAKKCKNCNSRRVNVIRVKTKKIPTYFCECERCLHRSEYKHCRNGAIKDWNGEA